MTRPSAQAAGTLTWGAGEDEQQGREQGAHGGGGGSHSLEQVNQTVVTIKVSVRVTRKTPLLFKYGKQCFLRKSVSITPAYPQKHKT